MSDTRTLLNRIASFRQRLEQTPSLVMGSGEGTALVAEVTSLAAHPERLARTLRTLSADPVDEGPLPRQLVARARKLLEEARGLVAVQRRMSDDPFYESLRREAVEGRTPHAIVTYHQETVALTESALRMVQAFPESAEAQVRMCEGLEAMLRAVRDRLAVGQSAIRARRTDEERIDGLARHLLDLAMGKVVNLDWIAELSEQLLDEARQAMPLRWITVEITSAMGYLPGPLLPAPSRFVAGHALTVAQVMARIVHQDYEWASRPAVPVMTALLMDLGMVRIPVEVLTKTTPWTVEERRMVEDHARFGAERMRTNFPDAAPVAAAIAAHHERPDGTGYPAAMRSEEIPSLARLLAACDTYAAMGVDRPHRPGKDPRTALTDTLLAAEHGRLDRDCTEYLIHLAFHPVGTVVELTDGRVGVVVANHTNRANLRATARPVVGVLTDAGGLILPRPEFVDLAAAERGGVVRVLTMTERRSLLAKYYPELCG